MTDASFDTQALVESVEQVLGDLLDVRGRQRVAEGDAALARDIWSTAQSLGWLSIGVSEEKGGLGLGVGGLAALQRALGAAVTPGPLLATLVAAQWLDEADDCSDVVAALIGGDASAAVPADFSVASRLTCSGSTLAGVDELLMFGAVDAGHYLIPVDDGRVLLCEGSPGRVRPVDGWDRSQGLFRLETAGLARRAVGAGAVGAARLEALLLLLLAADSQGGAEAILAATIDYMKMREQFGQPIGAFQALKHRAANLSADVMIGARIVRQAIDQDGGDAAMLWANSRKHR
ncbi:acyl-CoA dehydrogenase family protein [Sphingopyxis fribergensis]